MTAPAKPIGQKLDLTNSEQLAQYCNALLENPNINPTNDELQAIVDKLAENQPHKNLRESFKALFAGKTENDVIYHARKDIADTIIETPVLLDKLTLKIPHDLRRKAPSRKWHLKPVIDASNIYRGTIVEKITESVKRQVFSKNKAKKEDNEKLLAMLFPVEKNTVVAKNDKNVPGNNQLQNQKVKVIEDLSSINKRSENKPGIISAFNEAFELSGSKRELVDTNDFSALKSTGIELCFRYFEKQEQLDLEEIKALLVLISGKNNPPDLMAIFCHSKKANDNFQFLMKIGEFLKESNLTDTTVKTANTIFETCLKKLFTVDINSQLYETRRFTDWDFVTKTLGLEIEPIVVSGGDSTVIPVTGAYNNLSQEQKNDWPKFIALIEDREFSENHDKFYEGKDGFWARRAVVIHNNKDSWLRFIPLSATITTIASLLSNSSEETKLKPPYSQYSETNSPEKLADTDTARLKEGERKDKDSNSTSSIGSKNSYQQVPSSDHEVAKQLNQYLTPVITFPKATRIMRGNMQSATAKKYSSEKNSANEESNRRLVRIEANTTLIEDHKNVMYALVENLINGARWDSLTTGAKNPFTQDCYKLCNSEENSADSAELYKIKQALEESIDLFESEGISDTTDFASVISNFTELSILGHFNKEQASKICLLCSNLTTQQKQILIEKCSCKKEFEAIFKYNDPENKQFKQAVGTLKERYPNLNVDKFFAGAEQATEPNNKPTTRKSGFR
jgi:hypothetical protein